MEKELSLESYRLSQQHDVHGSYHIEGEIYSACVQSVLKYVTEAREMKDENLKVFRRQNVHIMVRWMWSVLEETKAQCLYCCTEWWLAIIVHTYADLSFTDPFEFLFETLSNRRSLACIFIRQCVSESATSCLHIYSVCGWCGTVSQVWML